ncbi:KTSC domain protein [compost metagenome]
MKKIFTTVLLTLILASSAAVAETVFVKYHGSVDLEPFTCTDTVSSFVNRVCYQPDQSYLIVLLGDTYYHYCRIPSQVVSQWLNADSKGRFYNGSIKGNFDCRLGGIPD